VPGIRGTVEDLLDPSIVIVIDPSPVVIVPLMRFSLVRGYDTAIILSCARRLRRRLS